MICFFSGLFTVRALQNALVAGNVRPPTLHLRSSKLGPPLGSHRADWLCGSASFASRNTKDPSHAFGKGCLVKCGSSPRSRLLIIIILQVGAVGGGSAVGVVSERRTSGVLEGLGVRVLK